MTNIKIEQVGDINLTYRYLEVFLKDEANPFMDIGITDEKKLSFKYYSSTKEVMLTVEDWEYILKTAEEFLPKALADEEGFNNWPT